MSSTRSYQVGKGLYLIRQKLTTVEAPAKPVEPPANHFAIIDCSGSMYSDLPKIREQLKKKLPKLLKEGDTISLLWFSGRGEFGTLLEAEPVASLTDLKAVEQAIDRWLRPLGLTGFREPILEAGKVVQRVKTKHPKNSNSLFFMSDGCDNQSTRPAILEAISAVAPHFSAATMVEYGYYADRALLAQMAERFGGQLIFAEDFDRYAPAFEAVMQKRPTGAPQKAVEVPTLPIGGFLFSIGKDNELLTYHCDGKALVPEDTNTVWYLSETSQGDVDADLASTAKLYANNNASSGVFPAHLQAAYAAISLFATRMQPNIVLPLLKALGDVRLIEQFSACFGKQKYSAFQETAKEAAFQKNCYTNGYDPNKVPRDDAFTLLDLLNLLSNDEGNRVLLDHPEFKYSRIGRARMDASEQLSADEQAKLTTLTEELGRTKKAARVAEITAEIAALTSNRKEPLKFVADPAPDGYPISSLVWNEDRPNVSFMVRKTGTVDLTTSIKDTDKALVFNEDASKFKTFVFRNYAIVKDGLVNITKLPVRLTAATLQVLVREGVLPDATVAGPTTDVVLDLSTLPIINRNMVKGASARKFFELQYALTQAQAKQKVFNAYAKEMLPARSSASFKDTYGDDVTLWLKDQGITDYSGFNPKTVVAEATDVYMGKELKVSLKGLSSLPTLKIAKEQITKNKSTPSGALMIPTVKLVEEFLASPGYQTAANKEKVLEVWLDGHVKAAKEKTRKLIYEIARQTFTIIVGQVWFSEFSSLDENQLTFEQDDATVTGTVEMKEVEIKI